MLTKGRSNWSLVLTAITASLSKLSKPAHKMAVIVSGKRWNLYIEPDRVILLREIVDAFRIKMLKVFLSPR